MNTAKEYLTKRLKNMLEVLKELWELFVDVMHVLLCLAICFGPIYFIFKLADKSPWYLLLMISWYFYAVLLAKLYNKLFPDRLRT